MRRPCHARVTTSLAPLLFPPRSSFVPPDYDARRQVYSAWMQRRPTIRGHQLKAHGPRSCAASHSRGSYSSRHCDECLARSLLEIVLRHLTVLGACRTLRNKLGATILAAAPVLTQQTVITPRHACRRANKQTSASYSVKQGGPGFTYISQ